MNDNTATVLVCAGCGEESTNPGQFMDDGRWVCSQVCKDEVIVDLLMNDGIPQDEDKPSSCKADRPITKEAVTVWSEELGRNICGLCGSTGIVPGYGLAGGGGVGAYNFCDSCLRVLDKTADSE